MVQLRRFKAKFFNKLGTTKAQGLRLLYKRPRQRGRHFESKEEVADEVARRVAAMKENMNDDQLVKYYKNTHRYLQHETKEFRAERELAEFNHRRDRREARIQEYLTAEVDLYKKANRKDQRRIEASKQQRYKNGKRKRVAKHLYVGEQMYTKITGVRLNVADVDVERAEVGVLYVQTRDPTSVFAEVMMNLADHETVQEQAAWILNYVDGFKIKSKIPLRQQPRILGFLEELRYRSELKINHPYINYEYNKEGGTIDKTLGIKYIDYVTETYKKERCGYTILINVYKESIEKQFKTVKLTYEYLFKLFHDREPGDDEDWGLSVKNLAKFFRKFRLKLVVFYCSGKVRFQWSPEDDNLTTTKKINPRCLYLLAKNTHFYHLNSDIKVLEQIKNNGLIDGDGKELVVSDRYPFIEPSEQRHDLFTYDVDEIFAVDFTKYAYLKVQFNGNLDELLTDLVYKYNYEPKIGTSGGYVTEITMKINKCTIKIKNQTQHEFETPLQVDDEDHYKLYQDMFQSLYQSVLNRSNLSTYNPEFINALRTYSRTALRGKFPKHNFHYDFASEIDIRRAYASDLMELPGFPIFNVFDVFEKYDHSALEACTFYFVRSKAGTTDPAVLCYFDKKYVIVTGFTLQHMPKKLYKILYMARPHNIRPNRSKDVIKSIYESDLDDDERKNIVNQIIGMACRTDRKKESSVLFTDGGEAAEFKEKQGGELICVESDDKKPYYFVTIKAKKQMVEGFYPIQFMIYDLMRYKMYELCKKLQVKNIDIIGIATDAIFIEDTENKAADLISTKKGFKSIGSYRFEAGASVPDNVLKFRENEIMQIKSSIVNELELTDEYDKKEICKTLNQHKLLSINGLYPGVGKTTACEIYIQQKKKTALFVTPQNELAGKLIRRGNEAVTLARFCGFRVTDSGEEKEAGSRINVDDYHVIIFDEIYFYSTVALARIQHFMQSHPKHQIIVCGDCDQNRPIEQLTIKNNKKYYTKIINSMFPNRLLLKINKRLKNEEDRLKLTQIKHDIFETKLTPMEIVEKHGFKVVHKMSDVSGFGVCYYNFTVDRYNKYVHSKIDYKDAPSFDCEGTTFYEGMNVTCRKHHQQKDQRLYVNYTYKIKEFDAKTVTLVDEYSEEEYELSMEMFSKFKLPFAKTCHSAQGSSIDENITICDLRSKYVDKEWFWTALTRVTDFNNITIYDKKDDEFVDADIQKKIKSYRKQDEKAGREYAEDDFVDVAHVKDLLKKQKYRCGLCGIPVQVRFFYSCDGDQYSVDRVVDSLPHTKDNCRITCLKCNQSRVKY